MSELLIYMIYIDGIMLMGLIILLGSKLNRSGLFFYVWKTTGALKTLNFNDQCVSCKWQYEVTRAKLVLGPKHEKQTIVVI